MKKCVMALALTLTLLLGMSTVPAAAYTAGQLNTADALYHLGLFLGYGDTYGLNDGLTRNQGVILLVRMLGKEEEAKKEPYSAPFTDVANAAKPHVSYAYSHKIANGYNAGSFGGTDKLSDKQFCAFTLRALGYTDSGAAPDFTYAESREMAKKVGLLTSSAANNGFDRGNVVEIFWRALNTNMNNSEQTLAEFLCSAGVFTKSEWNKAVDIQEHGRNDEDDSGERSPAVSDTCEHQNVSSAVTKEASCTDFGERSFSCPDCGKTWTEQIAKTEHSWDAGVKQADGSGGNEMVYTCTVCGETKRTALPDEPQSDKLPTWEEYSAMDDAAQLAFFMSFSNPADYFAWQQKAQAEYAAEHPAIIVDPSQPVVIG